MPPKKKPMPKSKPKVKGFKKNAQKIAKEQGISEDKASAILASSTRKASPAAKKRNPALKKVKGKAKPPMRKRKK